MTMNEPDKAVAEDSKLEQQRDDMKLTGWAVRFQRKPVSNCICAGNGSENCNCNTQPWFGVYY